MSYNLTKAQLRIENRGPRPLSQRAHPPATTSFGPSAFRYPRRVRSRSDPRSGPLDVERLETGGACDCPTVCDGPVTLSTPLSARRPHMGRAEGMTNVAAEAGAAKGIALQVPIGRRQSRVRHRPQGNPSSGYPPSSDTPMPRHLPVKTDIKKTCQLFHPRPSTEATPTVLSRRSSD